MRWSPEAPPVRTDDAFGEALGLMKESNCPARPVVDRLGRFVGRIAMEEVGELVLLQTPRPANGGAAQRMARHGRTTVKV